MVSENFCLKWNDHHSIFFSSAESLCSNQNLTDVVLSAGGRQFEAHKLVLSICSNYFSDLFSASSSVTRGRAAVVFLKDVDPRHLELILNYMYRGEVNVQENDLMSLLNTAKGLQVKGLTNDNEDVESKPAKQDNTKYAAKRQLVEHKIDSDNEISVIAPTKRIKEEISQDSLVENSPLKAVEQVKAPYKYPVPNYHQPSSGYNLGPTSSSSRGLDSPSEGGWKSSSEAGWKSSSEAGWKSSSEGGWLAENDINDTYDGYNGDYDDEGGYNDGEDGRNFAVVDPKDEENKCECSYCGKKFQSAWYLNRHMLSHTREKNLKCDLCGKGFGRNDNLLSHKRTVHLQQVAI